MPYKISGKSLKIFKYEFEFLESDVPGVVNVIILKNIFDFLMRDCVAQLLHGFNDVLSRDLASRVSIELFKD